MCRCLWGPARGRPDCLPGRLTASLRGARVFLCSSVTSSCTLRWLTPTQKTVRLESGRGVSWLIWFSERGDEERTRGPVLSSASSNVQSQMDRPLFLRGRVEWSPLHPPKCHSRCTGAWIWIKWPWLGQAGEWVTVVHILVRSTRPYRALGAGAAQPSLGARGPGAGGDHQRRALPWVISMGLYLDPVCVTVLPMLVCVHLLSSYLN